MKHVMPTLTQGLIDCCKTRPDDSIDYLVSYAYTGELGYDRLIGTRKIGPSYAKSVIYI